MSNFIKIKEKKYPIELSKICCSFYNSLYFFLVVSIFFYMNKNFNIISVKKKMI